MYNKLDSYILYKKEDLHIKKYIYKPIAVIQFNDDRLEFTNIVALDEFKIIVGEIENIDLLELIVHDEYMNPKKVKGINLNDFLLMLIVFNTPEKAFKKAKKEYEEAKNEILLKDILED